MPDLRPCRLGPSSCLRGGGVTLEGRSRWTAGRAQGDQQQPRLQKGEDAHMCPCVWSLAMCGGRLGLEVPATVLSALGEGGRPVNLIRKVLPPGCPPGHSGA